LILAKGKSGYSGPTKAAGHMDSIMGRQMGGSLGSSAGRKGFKKGYKVRGK